MTEGIEESAARWSWLDRWLEPQWRALVTWLVLATVTAAACQNGLERGVEMMNSRATGLLDPYLSFLSSLAMRNTLNITHVVLLMVWFQPVILRVGPLRWIIWMLCAGITAAIVSWYHYHTSFAYGPMPPAFWSWPILAGLSMIGCRSRPWMCIPAGALSLIVTYYARSLPAHVILYADPWWWPVVNIPYAILMLYGTRLLRPVGRKVNELPKHMPEESM